MTMERALSMYEGADALTSDDVADCVHWAATRPPRVNINTIQLMPVCQAPSRLAIHRTEKK
jgi:3-hydroxy acid dehydrogenase/malonic semialdehyde reductase